MLNLILKSKTTTLQFLTENNSPTNLIKIFLRCENWKNAKKIIRYLYKMYVSHFTCTHIGCKNNNIESLLYLTCNWIRLYKHKHVSLHCLWFFPLLSISIVSTSTNHQRSEMQFSHPQISHKSAKTGGLPLFFVILRIDISFQMQVQLMNCANQYYLNFSVGIFTNTYTYWKLRRR